MSIFPIAHVGISCKDPMVIEKFYTKYFGFKRSRVYAPGPDQVVMLRAGATCLELFKATLEPPIPPPTEAGVEFPGWKHICFQVENLDDKLMEMGMDVRITKGPVDMSVFIEGMKVCWLADPEGNIIELNQGYVDEF
jgi:glyoxylase I family protein